MLKPGNTVLHPAFGEGTIQEQFNEHIYYVNFDGKIIKCEENNLNRKNP
jgi:hypothetical protein